MPLQHLLTFSPVYRIEALVFARYEADCDLGHVLTSTTTPTAAFSVNAIFRRERKSEGIADLVFAFSRTMRSQPAVQQLILHLGLVSASVNFETTYRKKGPAHGVTASDGLMTYLERSFYKEQMKSVTKGLKPIGSALQMAAAFQGLDQVWNEIRTQLLLKIRHIEENDSIGALTEKTAQLTDWLSRDWTYGEVDFLTAVGKLQDPNAWRTAKCTATPDSSFTTNTSGTASSHDSPETPSDDEGVNNEEFFKMRIGEEEDKEFSEELYPKPSMKSVVKAVTNPPPAEVVYDRCRPRTKRAVNYQWSNRSRTRSAGRPEHRSQSRERRPKSEERRPKQETNAKRRSASDRDPRKGERGRRWLQVVGAPYHIRKAPPHPPVYTIDQCLEKGVTPFIIRHAGETFDFRILPWWCPVELPYEQRGFFGRFVVRTLIYAGFRDIREIQSGTSVNQLDSRRWCDIYRQAQELVEDEHYVYPESTCFDWERRKQDLFGYKVTPMDYSKIPKGRSNDDKKSTAGCPWVVGASGAARPTSSTPINSPKRKVHLASVNNTPPQLPSDDLRDRKSVM